MRPPVRPPARGRGLSTLIRRYESGALGLPSHGCYFTISQSQFERWACARKGWFSEIEGLRTGATMEMHLGTAWDAWKRDVWTWWQERDEPFPEYGLDRCVWCDGEGCERCGWDGRSSLDLAVEVLERAGEESWRDDTERFVDTLRRMAEGWIAHYEGGRLQSFEVAGVQLSLARQVMNPATGEPYCPVAYLVETDPVEEVTPLGFTTTAQRWRIAKTGEGGHAVRWPWYQIGTIDVLLRDRQHRTGYAVDDKASASLSKYADAVKIDPQLPGYCWMLEPHAEALGLSSVAGFFYEVAATRYQRDPEFLKPKYPPMDELRDIAKARGLKVLGKTKEDFLRALDIPEPPPELSRDSGAFTPSWRYQRAVEQGGLSLAAYEDHLEYLRHHVDPECYARGGLLMLPYSASVGARYERELFARVQILAEKRRQAALSTSVYDLDIHFPRTAICKLGARCSYTHVCPTHEADSSTIRTGFGTESEQVWGVPGVTATDSAGGANERAEHDTGHGAGEEEDEHSGAGPEGF